MVRLNRGVKMAVQNWMKTITKLHDWTQEIAAKPLTENSQDGYRHSPDLDTTVP